MSAEASTRFRLLSLAQLYDLPDPSWLIRGVLPANALAVLYGEPGSGKTFIALSMAASIAAEHNWCGKVTARGSVLYLAAEGVLGFKLRVRAYVKKHALEVRRINFVGDAFNLLEPNDITGLSQTLNAAEFQPDLIILDTLARVMPGAEENSAKEMGEAIASIDALRQPTSATVLVVHHTVKAGRSERGSSALRGAADVMIECSRDSGTGLVSLQCTKMKDAEPFPAAMVHLERITLDPSSSSLAVTDWKETTNALAAADGAKKALDLLRDKFGASGATYSQWQTSYCAQSRESKSSFDRALRKLKDDGAVRLEGKRYFEAVDVSVSEVSTRCHDTSAEGVTSPPS